MSLPERDAARDALSAADADRLSATDAAADSDSDMPYITDKESVISNP
jgi:hypothetical protein